ncbi:hypothetical protein [Streptomyces sp. NPDC050988]|uniref:hypothetical protein n=1 Tax=Streptomyces sp. NPDC050988 TaxID=3365637 RepID=UPI0037A00F7F
MADKLRAAFLKDIADRARKEWGSLWDEHCDAWAAASAAQQDPASAWDSRLGPRTEDLGAQAIAEALVSAIPRSLRRPGQELLVLNKPPLARERVAAVEAALAESGVAGLVQVPRSVAIQEPPSSLLLGSDSVTGRALEELAGTALELLPGTRN